ncbi:MAG: cupredoxin domain-containing protein [Pseudobdellovibrio sp.]
MNSANFKIVKSFTRAFLFSFFFFAQVKIHALEIDLSRRQGELQEMTSALRSPSAVLTPEPSVVVLPGESPAVVKDEKAVNNEIIEALKKVVMPVDVSKEIVIAQTEDGFVPSLIQVKKGEIYKIHIVNLNMKEKNVSFLMDSFTQAHNTVYGSLKTFTIEPKVEGIFSFQCPETGVQGKIVVLQDNLKARKVASEK